MAPPPDLQPQRAGTSTVEFFSSVGSCLDFQEGAAFKANQAVDLTTFILALVKTASRKDFMSQLQGTLSALRKCEDLLEHNQTSQSDSLQVLLTIDVNLTLAPRNRLHLEGVYLPGPMALCHPVSCRFHV